MADSTATVGAVDTCFDIVEELRDGGALGVTELADRVSVSKSAVHKQLRTLVERGYAEKEGGKYRLTLALLGVGRTVQHRRQLYQVGKRPLDDLASSTGYIVGLLVPEGDYGVYLYRTGDDSLGAPVLEGQQCHLHATAGGKAILASLESQEVEARLNRAGTPELTSKTTTDRTALFRELRSVGDRGLAFDRGESHSDWQGVATPVLVEDTAVAAISVYGRSSQMRGKTLTEDVPGLLVSVRKDIEMALRRE